MKKFSLVLLIVVFTLVAKFLFENLGGNPFVFKYNLKTSEKEVSLLLQSGGEIASQPPQVILPPIPEIPEEKATVLQEKPPPSKWLGLDLEELDLNIEFKEEDFEAQVEKAHSEVFEEANEETLKKGEKEKWFFPDFEFVQYDEDPSIEVDYYKTEALVREKEIEVEIELRHIDLEEYQIAKALVEGEKGEGSELTQYEEKEVSTSALAQEASQEVLMEEASEEVPVENLAQGETEEESGWRSWFKKDTENEVVLPDDPEKRDIFLKRMTIRHIAGHQGCDCIPFASNFTSLEFFLSPEYRLGKVMPFIDLRGHRFDNNTYALNAGIGGRYIPNPRTDSFCEMLGLNAYYDYRQGCVGYYNQVGFGIEILNKRWDFRANAYVPFGKRKHIQVCTFDDFDGDFFAERRDIESISYSFNAEIGYLAIRSQYFLLYAAAGPYFLARGKFSGATPGGEIRIRPQYKDYLAVDLSWRHDGLFNTIWQFEVIVNLPLYQIRGKNRRPCGLSDRQIYQPIERFEVMPLRKVECWDFNWDDTL